MDVSVIIVNWDTEALLRECLQSVFDATRGIDFEVIVIDNASRDGSVAMVEKEYPQVELVKNPDNKGFATANNQGIARAQGRYVLLLNSDTVVLDDAIEATVRFADARPKVAVAGCRVLNADRSLQPTCFMYPSLLNMLLSSSYLYKLFPGSRFFGRERMTWWDRADTRDVDVVTGCFMLVRRDAIDQVGRLDERFHMYGEETDWCYRFKEAGWRVVFAPDGQIIHYGGASSRQKPAEMTLQLRGSILLFLKKHRGILSYAAARVLVALYFFLRIPYWLCKGFLYGAQRRSCFSVVRTYFAGGYKSLFGLNLCVKEP
jgi:GT2 family glycosyltransferase